MPVTMDMVEELIARYGRMKEDRSNYDLDWQDVQELVLPGASDIITRRVPGETRTERLFDTTGTTAVHTLAANIQGAVTNQALEWFRMQFRDESLNDIGEVSEWLARVNQVMLAAYNGSNFYQAAHTYYVNLAAFGTAAMFVGQRQALPHETPGDVYLRFKTLPTGSYCIAENADGMVDTLFRIMMYTPRQAYQLWGDDMSQQMHQRLMNPAMKDQYVEFLHCVYPRRDRRPSRIDNTNMPWASVVLELDTRHVVHESGFEEFPFLVSRWETLDNSPWGYGPGHIALPDIRTINKLKEMHLLQLVLWVQPPLKQLREGVIGGVSLEPYAVNVVTQMDALQTLDFTGRPDLVKIDQAELKQSIRDIFYVDALQGLPPPDASKMTAFEVAQRVEQMQRLMGPAFSRLLAEMLDPMADRVFGIFLRASLPRWLRGQGGVFPRMPLAVQQAASQNNGQLDVSYEGPLARAQRGADIRAIHEVYGVAAQIVEITQDIAVLDALQHDAILRHTARVSGLPRHLLRDIYQVGRMRQARQRAQQQLQVAEELRQDVTAIGRVAPAIREFGQLAEAA